MKLVGPFAGGFTADIHGLTWLPACSRRWYTLGSFRDGTFFGFAWLAIIYEQLGDFKKAEELIKNLIASDTPDGLPELYFSNSPKYNENTPLGWSESLFIVALYEMERKLEKE